MATRILGIESSCDETAAALVEDGRILRSSTIRSSAPIHKEYGGVVPEIASREHLEAIVPVVCDALSEAGQEPEDLAAIAVCSGPGLLGSLIVGVAAAKALAASWQKPLVAVHHLAAHIAANYLGTDLEPPFLALVVSGAHSHLVEVRSYTEYRIIGSTRDDAPGEAYDKISREIGLSYPGGPKLDRLSREGDPNRLDLPHSRFEGSLDFSFSGIKTATLNALNQAEQKARQRGQRRQDILKDEDLAASFQKAVVDTLIEHTEEAVRALAARTLVLAGGVSANSGLREAAKDLADRYGLALYMPPLSLCTDNAAMTACQGFYEFEAGRRAPLSLSAAAMWELGEAMPQ